MHHRLLVSVELQLLFLLLCPKRFFPFLFQRHSFFHNGALKTKTQGRFEACFVGNMKTAEENSKVPERHKNRPLEDVAVALVIKQPTGSSRGKTTVSLDTLRLCWATATVHSGLYSVFSNNCLKNVKIGYFCLLSVK